MAAEPRVLRTETLEAGRLAQLAAEPGKMVYTFAYDTPAGTMGAHEQLQHLESVIVNFDAVARRHPNEATEALRERVLALSSPRLQFRQFQRLYAKTFALVTQRVYDAEDEARLDKLRKGILFAVRNKAAAAPGVSHETITAGVMQEIMRLSMHPATAADAAAAQRVPMEGDGLPDVEGTERVPAVLPMDRMELGESTVRQLPTK